MKAFHLRRSAALAVLIAAGTLAATLLVAPVAAQANVLSPAKGSEPGNLILSPASGASSLKPNYSTTDACPVGIQASMGLDVVPNTDFGGPTGIISVAVPPAQLAAPFGGQLGFDMATILSVAGPAGQTYELVVECKNSPFQNPGLFVQSTFVTYSADGNSWTSSGTPPGPGPATTTTTMTASPNPAIFGSTVTLNASVTPAAAAGSVEFFDGVDSLGTATIASGHAIKTISTLQVGDHPIHASFEANSSFAASSSSPLTVTINPAGSNSGGETIDVNVPLSEGVFTLTVSPDAVHLTQAENKGTFFESTGSLSPVTVSDGRQQSKPGWSVSGQVSDFTAGANSFSGSNLGWTPQVTTQNTAADVVAGPSVVAGTNPGLKQGSGLASALASKGLGTTVLGAGLDLQIPVDTAVGTYTALLTVTAVTHA